MRVSLPVQTSQIASEPASTSVLLNCMVEQLPQDAKTPVLLSRAAGIETLATVGNGPIYGLHGAFQKLYAVSGTKLYEVYSN
jgi:hypothetical protein